MVRIVAGTAVMWCLPQATGVRLPPVIIDDAGLVFKFWAGGGCGGVGGVLFAKMVVWW